MRVPPGMRRLFMVSEDVMADRLDYYNKYQKPHSKMPAPHLAPRHLKIMEVARREGVYGRWANLKQLESLMGRHTIGESGKNVFQAFYSEKNQLSFFKSGTARWLAVRANMFVPPDVGFVEVPSWVTKPQAELMFAHLKFTMGSWGVILMEYPFIDWPYGLVKVIDRELFKKVSMQNSTTITRNSKMHGSIDSHAYFELHHDRWVNDTVMTDEEVQVRLKSPKPEIDFSRIAPASRASNVEIQSIANDLKNLIEMLGKRQK